MTKFKYYSKELQEQYADKLSEYYPFSGQQIIELLNEVVYSGMLMQEATAVIKGLELYEAKVAELQEDNKTLRFVLDQRRRHND